MMVKLVFAGLIVVLLILGIVVALIDVIRIVRSDDAADDAPARSLSDCVEER